MAKPRVVIGALPSVVLFRRTEATAARSSVPTIAGRIGNDTSLYLIAFATGDNIWPLTRELSTLLLRALVAVHVVVVAFRIHHYVDAVYLCNRTHARTSPFRPA